MRSILLVCAILAAWPVQAAAQYYDDASTGCGCPPPKPSPCRRPAEQPRDFPPEERGAYVAPPRVGIEEGEGRGYGIRGLGLRFPAWTFRLPTLQLPHMVTYRRRPRMLIEPAEAPYVEEVVREEYPEEAAPRAVAPREQEKPRPIQCPPCQRPISYSGGTQHGASQSLRCDARAAEEPSSQRTAFVAHQGKEFQVASWRAPKPHFRDVNQIRRIDDSVADSERELRGAIQPPLQRLEQMVREIEVDMEEFTAARVARQNDRERAVVTSAFLQPVEKRDELKLLRADGPISNPPEDAPYAPHKAASLDFNNLLFGIAGALIGLTAGFAAVCFRMVQILTRLRPRDWNEFDSVAPQIVVSGIYPRQWTRSLLKSNVG